MNITKRLDALRFSLNHMSYLSRAVRKEIGAWKAAGRPVPPPDSVKRRTIWSYAKKSGLKVLVETGTYYGGTVATLQCRFGSIYSIELSEALFERARNRFEGVDNVHLICGDSSVELKNLLGELDQSAVFWLDAHWSGGTTARGDKDNPILDELDLILGQTDKRHAILIDDARLFGADPGYPMLEEVRELVGTRRPDLEFTVKDDIIRIVPARLAGRAVAHPEGDRPA
jgi:SAM-dependent methyltransferase